ncbi:unnamed protein product [Penicillium viridicatum]
MRMGIKMLNAAGSISLVLASSKTPVTKAPFIYSRTEELVWKWEQSKLCGQSINIRLSSIMLPQGHPPNKADSREEFASVENGVVHVFPQAQLTNLEHHEYQIGIIETAQPENLKIILISAKKGKQAKGLRAILFCFQHCTLERVPPFFNSWSTEFWVSDSVVIDSKSIEEAELMLKALHPERLDETAYVCAGLPVTIFGPLFNTLISEWNTSAASFEYSNNFIWIYSAVDPTNFMLNAGETKNAGESDSSTNHSVSSMLKRMSGKSWLVRAKLMFRLETSSREKAVILAELLEISHIQITSSHKPITHS